MLSSHADPIFRPFLVPSRFEAIEEDSTDALSNFIFPVQESLDILEQLLINSEISKRGQFFVLESKSGVGKTTFLKTANLFSERLSIFSIAENFASDLAEFVTDKMKNAERALFILEGRESIDHVSDLEISEVLHKLNQVLRRIKGKPIIFAWPCNSSDLAGRLFRKATEIGGEALIDPTQGLHKFKGPPKREFRHIVSSTLTMLNDGADVADLGVDEFWFTEALNQSESIGAVFEKIAQQIARKRRELTKFARHERYRVWILVAAGSEPEKEIAGLTRGSFGSCDIQRLCNGTRANIVREIKSFPEKLGLLAGFFDARITYVPVVTLLSIARAFADSDLQEKLKEANIRIDIADKEDAISRLKQSQLVQILSNEQIGLFKSRAGIGPDTRKSFTNLAGIASKNDRKLNKALAEALHAAGLISRYEAEVDFGSGLTRRTDLVIDCALGRIRLEVMWRNKTSKADIANYTLTKLYNYGKALGFLGAADAKTTSAE